MKWWQKIRNWFKKTFLNQTIESPDMAEESFLEWLGLKKKNRNGALSEVTYFTCLKMMSETVAKLPWKYYQKTASGIDEPELNDVAKLLKYRPNPFMTPTAFWNAVEMNRNHFGNAYVYVRSKFSRKRYGGEYKVLDYKRHGDSNTLTKELVITPGQHISYQRHRKRTEIWTFTEGAGELIIEGKVTAVGRGDTAVIRPGTRHAIKAVTELHIIEVQMGDELTEDDIERLDWNWE